MRGRIIGAFFAPASEWRLMACATIASRLQANLKSGIITTTRFPKEICADVARFGVDVDKALATGMFHIADWYTCITGRVPTPLPDDMPASLRVADLGVLSAKQWHVGQGIDPDTEPEFTEFALFDNLARLFSYNDETSCIKFLNTTLARVKQDSRVSICGFATGVLGEKTYSDLESMCDGIMDIRALEADGIMHTIVRVRAFPDVQHTKGWHVVTAQPKAVTLAPISQSGAEIYRAVGSLRNSQLQSD